MKLGAGPGERTEMTKDEDRLHTLHALELLDTSPARRARLRDLCNPHLSRLSCR